MRPEDDRLRRDPVRESRPEGDEVRAARVAQERGKSFPRLVRDMIDETRCLIQNEVRLARVETKDMLNAIQRNLTTIGIGAGFGLGAMLALVLASVGIYGVVAYAVTRRYREIGIRMALGAGTGNVLRMILRTTMRPVVVGAVIGVAAAAAVSNVLTSVLFGVSPADPVGLGGSALLVLGVALAAGVMAARPATQTDPTATLRHD